MFQYCGPLFRLIKMESTRQSSHHCHCHSGNLYALTHANVKIILSKQELRRMYCLFIISHIFLGF